MKVLTEAKVHAAAAMCECGDVEGLAILTTEVDDGTAEAAAEIAALCDALGMPLSCQLWLRVMAARRFFSDIENLRLN